MLNGIRDAMTSLEARMDRRFEQMDRRFEQLKHRMDARFAQVDARFAQIDAALRELEGEQFIVMPSAEPRVTIRLGEGW